MIILAFWLIFAVLVAVYAERKGRSGAGFFFLSLFLSPLIGFIIAAAVEPKKQKVAEQSGMKKCPDCAEYVQGEARVCRFCGFKFIDMDTVKEISEAPRSAAPSSGTSGEGPDETNQNQEKRRIGIDPKWGMIALVVVIVTCLGILGHSAGCDSNQDQQAVQQQAPLAPRAQAFDAAPQLALLSSRGYPSDDEGSYYYVEGQVKNISTVSLSNIEAVVTWYTKNGQFIISDSALVKFNPILPGQVSPFETITTGNPRMAKYAVEFQNFGGGRINAVDRRKGTSKR